MPRLADVILRGTTAAQPAANAVAEGSLYFDTDLSTLQRSNGTTWQSVSPSAVLGDADYGDITVSSSGTVFTVDNSAITLAKIANAAANDKVLGSGNSGSGNPYTEITLGTGLSMSGTTLSSTSSYDSTVPSSQSDFVDAADCNIPGDIPGVGEGYIFVNIDGGGSAITTGVKGDLYIPFSIKLHSVTLIADQSGSIVIDIWNDLIANYPPTVADTITASDKPTLSTAVTSQDNNITTWTTLVPGGSTMRFNVDSITTVQRVQMILGYQRADVQ